jgi:hypothetical protein
MMKEFGFGRTLDFTGKLEAQMVQAVSMRLELFANRFSDLFHNVIDTQTHPLSP